MSRCRKLSARLSVLLLAVVGCAIVFASSAAAATAPVGVFSATQAASVSGTTALKSPPIPAGAFFNRPTVPLATYKALTANRVTSVRSGPSKAALPRTVASSFGFNGATQPQCGCAPSDSNGAVSKSQIAEVVNDQLYVTNKSGGLVNARSLATVSGYTAAGLTDPRIIYDPQWQRFVITVLGFPTSATNQALIIMVSKSGSASGAYRVYVTNALGGLCGGTNPFFDYPQLGMTQDALVITGNCFNSAGVSGNFVGLAKSIIYNGLGFSVPVFGFSGMGTATPAIVYDQRPANVILYGGGGFGPTEVYFQDPQAGGYSGISSVSAVSGFETFAYPRAAGQAGCTTSSCQLDTSDGRFVNDSSQFGDQLWNVQTLGFAGSNGSFATPYWGEFSIANHNTTQFGSVFPTACGDDFNASLLAQPSGKMELNWTHTDPSSCGGTFAEQYAAGRTSTTASGAVDNLIDVYNSSAELTGDFDPNFGLQRWGDTSSMSLDPSSSTNTWAINNSVLDTNDWGTRIQKITQ